MWFRQLSVQICVVLATLIACTVGYNLESQAMSLGIDCIDMDEHAQLTRFMPKKIMEVRG
jgi:hypothetical protein